MDLPILCTYVFMRSHICSRSQASAVLCIYSCMLVDSLFRYLLVSTRMYCPLRTHLSDICIPIHVQASDVGLEAGITGLAECSWFWTSGLSLARFT